MIRFYVENYSFPSLRLLERKVLLCERDKLNPGLQTRAWKTLASCFNGGHMTMSGLVQVLWDSVRTRLRAAPLHTCLLLM